MGARHEVKRENENKKGRLGERKRRGEGERQWLDRGEKKKKKRKGRVKDEVSNRNWPIQILRIHYLQNEP